MGLCGLYYNCEWSDNLIYINALLVKPYIHSCSMIWLLLGIHISQVIETQILKNRFVKYKSLENILYTVVLVYCILYSSSNYYYYFCYVYYSLFYFQVSYFATFCLVAVVIAVVSIYAGALNPIERGEWVQLYLCTLLREESELSCTCTCVPYWERRAVLVYQTLSVLVVSCLTLKDKFV